MLDGFNELDKLAEQKDTKPGKAEKSEVDLPAPPPNATSREYQDGMAKRLTEAMGKIKSKKRGRKEIFDLGKLMAATARR